MLTGLSAWMTEHDYVSVQQLCGSMSSTSVDNPGEFERAQYVRAITTWTPNR